MTYERIFRNYGDGTTLEILHNTRYPGVLEFVKNGRENKIVFITELFKKVLSED